MATCGYLKNEEAHDAENNDAEHEQKSADYKIRCTLLLGLRARDPESINK